MVVLFTIIIFLYFENRKFPKHCGTTFQVPSIAFKSGGGGGVRLKLKKHPYPRIFKILIRGGRGRDSVVPKTPISMLILLTSHYSFLYTPQKVGANSFKT